MVLVLLLARRWLLWSLPAVLVALLPRESMSVPDRSNSQQHIDVALLILPLMLSLVFVSTWSNSQQHIDVALAIHRLLLRWWRRRRR